MHGLGVLGQIETEIGARIGTEKLAAFREGLQALPEVLDQDEGR